MDSLRKKVAGWNRASLSSYRGCSDKVKGADLPKSFGDHISPPHAPEDRARESQDLPALLGFSLAFTLSLLFIFLFLPFRGGMITEYHYLLNISNLRLIFEGAHSQEFACI